MGAEAVQGPVVSRLGASATLAVRQQREQSLIWVCGDFDYFLGLRLTHPDIEVLDGTDLGPCDVPFCPLHPLVRFVFPIPSSDAASQDALDGAAVDLFEDPRAHDKTFRPPEAEEALPCPLHNCVGVCGPCYFLSDVDTEELEVAIQSWENRKYRRGLSTHP